ncbi:PAS/PAC sensor signal transduction histidine kinase [Caminicella sporogenes DSM 14501]|uniref:histidine kinase n=1 Tax=Caminicella sporogenes DSM 14501 TaxID=1121266 RepID=A0A1M6NH98_9FIRM|nr:ATP-binding protein [Caminicella sporogenes]RKD22205.1 PAS domain-containing sensor histidine kinase [Caminicella sporogenes]SHJ95006.1 PAS/PAC sensor signal transduction histidine kinase [Caminicella sporogenes DSM 14501]
MLKSIRWKFITIYFGLVFIAMAIIGVFIIQNFEKYHLNNVSEKLYRMATDYIFPDINNLIMTENKDLDYMSEQLQNIIDKWSQGFVNEEIFIIGDAKSGFKIIATNNNNFLGENAINELEYDLIIEGFKGKVIDKDIKFSGNQSKNMVFPISKNGEVKGVLYLRYNLQEIYNTLNQSKWILTQATMLALAITVLLGFLIARSITEPINDVTEKALEMAKGNFDQKVEVKSDDEIGKLAEMFNYLTDKLKTTLGEISSEKSKMETILNYMADGLIAVNTDGKIIHANPSAMRMLNFFDEDILKENYDDLIGRFNRNLTLEHIMQNNNEWIGSEIISIKDSIYKVNYAPYKNEKNEKGGLVLVIQDITEQEKLENMRKEFVANVSHELKTPLTSIKSYTETLLNGALENKEIAKNFLSVVYSEADRMTRLVRDLLQLSNFDSKKVFFNKTKNDLVKLINNSIMKLDMTVKNKKQRLEFITKYDSLEGYFDYDRIEQVILNIISNAIKYTEERGKVEVFLEKEDNTAIIRVKDTGIGIPKEDLSRIFERFYRVDKARSRELGGTGLGLSIAKEIIEAHNGLIKIDSEVGKGTEVTIHLPLKEDNM